MSWIISILGVTGLCILLAGFMIPQILLISFRKKLFDVPDERKIHTSVVPRLGGIAFVPVIAFSLVLLFGIDNMLANFDLFYEVLDNAQCIAFCFCALLVLYVVGLADDLIGVKYRAKFVTQICSVTMLILGGLGVSNFHGFIGIQVVPAWVMWPFSLLLGIFIINAINLIDGIDGLASGLSSVAALVYGCTFYIGHEYLYALLSFATVGVLIPFFYYNVFGNPKKHSKIFMGDTGSLSIGLILVILSFKMLTMEPSNDFNDVSLLVVAMSPLIVPGFDVVRVYMYRIRKKRNPFLPDKNHIHHKILSLGVGQKTAMMIIVATSIVFTLTNICLSLWLNVNIVVAIDVVVWTIVMYLPAIILHRKSKSQN